MRNGLFVAAAVATLLAASLAAPAAGADHCGQSITIYSRRALVPGPPPPFLAATASSCVRVVGVTHHDALLVPGAEQVLVRFHDDLGPGVPTLLVVLDGLGFANQTFPLHRTAGLGGFVYDMADFASFPPDAPAEGSLTATVAVPGAEHRVTYRTL